MKHDQATRKTQGDFYRTRREKLSPSEFGLSNGSRRRTPGLRRDEVAALAGISTEWYTRIERGVANGLSSSVLDSLARAMRFTPAEIKASYQYANQVPSYNPPPLTEAKVTPALQCILDGLGIYPAYILAPRFDILAQNRSANQIYLNFEALPPKERNLVWLMFTHAGLHQMIIDRERHAQTVVGGLRANFARYMHDPYFSQLIEELDKKSPEFRKMWKRHDVGDRPETYKELNHPTFGCLKFEQSILVIPNSFELTLVVDTPADSETQVKLQKLGGSSPSKSRSRESKKARVP